ncbi:hypothetical protein [Salinifilum aidingensis]
MTRRRPQRQWITGGFALVALGWLTAIWLYQVGRVWTGCDAAFGNPDLHGNYASGRCVITGDTAALSVPWDRALNVGGLCALALVGVLAALLVPRRSRWSPLLATGGVVALLWAAPLGVQRVLGTRGGDVLHHLRGRAAELATVEQAPGGWWVVTAGPEAFGFPDFPGNEPLVAGAIAIVLAVLLAVLLWSDQLRGPAADRGPGPDGDAPGGQEGTAGGPDGTSEPAERAEPTEQAEQSADESARGTGPGERSRRTGA